MNLDDLRRLPFTRGNWKIEPAHDNNIDYGFDVFKEQDAAGYYARVAVVIGPRSNPGVQANARVVSLAPLIPELVAALRYELGDIRIQAPPRRVLDKVESAIHDWPAPETGKEQPR